jgi:hypothetical protein
VIRVDNAILADESKQVMGGQVADWKLPEKPPGKQIWFWLPDRACFEFLKRFNKLTPKEIGNESEG